MYISSTQHYHHRASFFTWRPPWVFCEEMRSAWTSQSDSHLYQVLLVRKVLPCLGARAPATQATHWYHPKYCRHYHYRSKSLNQHVTTFTILKQYLRDGGSKVHWLEVFILQRCIFYWCWNCRTQADTNKVRGWYEVGRLLTLPLGWPELLLWILWGVQSETGLGSCQGEGSARPTHHRSVPGAWGWLRRRGLKVRSQIIKGWTGDKYSNNKLTNGSLLRERKCPLLHKLWG